MDLVDTNSEMHLSTEMLEKGSRYSDEESDSIVENAIFWYCAITTYGNLYIGLYRDTTENNSLSIYKNTVLDIIKTLSREERMIQFIEDWLQEGLDLRPIQNIGGEYYTFKISDRNNVANNTSNKIIVKIDYNVLKSLPIPNWNSDNNLYITSCDIPTEIILSSGSIDSTYQDKLKENSILIIPESFSKGWLGYAKAEDIQADIIAISISENLQTIIINNEIHTPDTIKDETLDTSLNSLKVSIKGVTKLPFHFLLGWSSIGSCIISKPLNYYPVRISMGDRSIATGQLVSIPKGYGIYINEVL
jgi:flagellar motor switch/type III secretory pathway protein FliN